MAEAIADQEMTRRLSEAVHAMRLQDIPPGTRHAAKRALVNIVGCCVGGARHEIVETAVRALLRFGGSPTSGLLGRSERTDALSAAMLNGLSSAAYSFDDTHAQCILHPTGPAAAALFAYAGVSPLSGEQFLLALIAGVEIASRVSKAICMDPAQTSIGWSQTGVATCIGAAAAVGKAMNLDSEAIGWAIGHAAQQASGLRVAHGTMAATLIFGNAAQAGLRAALLAQEGMRGPSAPLEGRYGLLELFAQTPYPAHLTAQLGTRYEVDALTYKPYPCGIVLHPAVDAALAWHEQPHAQAPIAGVRLAVHPSALALGFRRHPTDPLQAKVSLYHWTAVALATGQAGLVQGQSGSIEDQEVARLRTVIDAQADTSLTPESARLSISLAGGHETTVEIPCCKGSITNPMTDADLNSKFHGQAQLHLLPDTAQAVLATCWSVERLGNVEELIALATEPGPRTSE